jgi:hypothetical protein
MFFGPITGISLIISLVVVLVGAIVRPVFFFVMSKRTEIFAPARRVRKPLTATSIVVILVAFYVTVTTYVVVETVGTPHTGMLAFASTLVPCNEVQVQPTAQNVILRLDDVQAYGWSDISVRMMEDAIAHDMPIVAGIIPKGIGEDLTLTNFLERDVCNIEFALHGYDHGAISDFDVLVGEFELLSYGDAKERLVTGIDEIHSAINVPITTFIPPQNRISLEATIALEEYNLFLSKSGNGYYDYDAKTWDYNEGTLVSAVEVIKTCDETFKTGDDVCVIMLHPQDFLNEEGTFDEAKYSEYLKLLDLIKVSGFSTVRFSDMIGLHFSGRQLISI